MALIFAARYLDVIRWGFKLTWMVLACTVAAEVVGKLVIKNGLASQLRPRKYYMVPRETFDSMVGDVHELVNFFVIEAQRIMFAENVTASAVVSPSIAKTGLTQGIQFANPLLPRLVSPLSSRTISSRSCHIGALRSSAQPCSSSSRSSTPPTRSSLTTT